MLPSRKEKESWRDELVEALGPLLGSLGFKRKSKDSYKRRASGKSDIYSICLRHPRTTAPPFLYVSASIGVDFPELRKLEWKLRPDPKGQELSAGGGMIGVFSEAKRHVEWPVGNLDSALALQPQFEADITKLAVPFWDAFPTVEALLAALEAEHPWTSLQRRRDSLRVAVLVLARDVEAALDFVREHPERYRRHGGVEGVSQKLKELGESWRFEGQSP